LSSIEGGSTVVEEPPKKAGKLFAFFVLLTSLIIAIAGLYIVFTKLNEGENESITIGLVAIVAILILLILSMMWKVLAGLRNLPEEGSTFDSPPDQHE
jgi:uncharacterized Tic20 family protein